ncbi:MAG: hypothetical protein ACKOAH_21525, partial [Pirellula sp.]
MHIACFVATDPAQGGGSVIVVQVAKISEEFDFVRAVCKFVFSDELSGFEGVVVPAPLQVIALNEVTGLAGDFW